MPASEPSTSGAPLPIKSPESRAARGLDSWPETDAEPNGGSLRGLVWAAIFEGAGLALAGTLLLLMGHWH